MRRLRSGVAVLLALPLSVVATRSSAATHAITQIDRSFRPPEITIAAGDSLQFNNEDEFIHQIYVDSDQINYDSAEQPPGDTITIDFPKAGTFPIRCHIHPKMLLSVHVK